MGAGSLGRPPSSSALFEVSFARASKVSLFSEADVRRTEAEEVTGRLCPWRMLKCERAAADQAIFFWSV